MEHKNLTNVTVIVVAQTPDTAVYSIVMFSSVMSRLSPESNM